MCTNLLSYITSSTSRNISTNRNIRLHPYYGIGLSESILLRYAETAADSSLAEVQQAEVLTASEIGHKNPVESISTMANSVQLQSSQVPQNKVLKDKLEAPSKEGFRSLAPGRVALEIGFSKSKLATTGRTKSKVGLKSSVNESDIEDGRPDPYSVPKISNLSCLAMRGGGDDIPKPVIIDVDRCVKYCETQIALNNDRSIDRSIIIDLNNFGAVDAFARDIHRRIDGNEIIDGYFMSSDMLTYPLEGKLGYHLPVIQSGNDLHNSNIIYNSIDLRTFDSYRLGRLIIDPAELKIIKLDGFEEHFMVQIVAIPNAEFIKRLKKAIVQLPGVITDEKSYYIELFTARMIENYF